MINYLGAWQIFGSMTTLFSSRSHFFPPKFGSMMKIWEHDKKLWSMTNLFMLVLPFFLSCSNNVDTFPTFRLNTSFVAVLKRSPSRFPFCQRSKYRQILSCSNIFIMLQFFLSCSNLFVWFLWKILEHEKINWSMTKILEHDEKSVVMLQYFCHAPIFCPENIRKCWSMIKKIGAWQKYWSMTKFVETLTAGKLETSKVTF